MMKLMLLASICQSSLQLIFLLSRPSHRVHCPCLARETAFALLSLYSCLRTSSTTSFLRSYVVALWNVGLLAARPKPPLLCWIFPTGNGANILPKKEEAGTTIVSKCKYNHGQC